MMQCTIIGINHRVYKKNGVRSSLLKGSMSEISFLKQKRMVGFYIILLHFTYVMAEK